MRKRRSDNEIMIDVLEEAARRSYSNEPIVLKQYGAAELPIILDLIEAGKVRGTVTGGQGDKNVGLQSITLEGRRLRDELVAQRDERRITARLKRGGWALLGVIGTLIVEYLKRKIAPH